MNAGYRRPVYLCLALATVAAGLTVRFAPLGLPWFVMKYGGSTLWAVMIYWVLVLAWPRRSPAALALVAGAIATLVEFSRLYHLAWLDAFRASLAGAVLLGRYFSVRNIVAYWVAIAAGALLDAIILRRAGNRALLKSNQPR